MIEYRRALIMIRRNFVKDSGSIDHKQNRSGLWASSIAAGAILFFALCSSLTAATLPSGFSETQIAGGLSSPTAMDLAPDGRIFVTLQGGQLRVVKNGVLLATPFLSLTVDSAGERGLLGVAFDPNFSSNNFVYVYYTVPGDPAHNRVSRFTANGDVALAGSELILVDLDNLSGAGNHNGGAIHFGPDGKLYIAVGDNANRANSQSLSTRLGKVLRVNADGSIPADNPFVNTAQGLNRSIWAMGLRNPFTFAFQPGTTRMFINDVGESTWEEINDGIAGSNYGWGICEGACSPPNASFRDPLFQYAHGSTSTEGCAIVGGGFYDPTTVQFPATYVGKYFFADLCNGWVRLFDPANNTATAFASGISQPVDLKVAKDGSLYYLAIGSAALFRVQFAGTAPSITTHPANQTVTQGQPATFNVSANGTAPLSFQWQRNQVNISGATSSSYTIAATIASDNGAKFRCLVTNAFGSATSNEATLTLVPPALATEDNSDSAIALNAVTLIRDPFPLTDPFNLSSDNRTRVMLFATNLILANGENASFVSARAEDAQMNIYPLTVEYVGPVPGFNWLTEIVVVLPGNLPTGQSVLISATWHTQTTNKARIRIK
jgi:glucose/arabinose dehydrogenase